MEMERNTLISIPAISIARGIFGRDFLEGLFSLFWCTVGDLISGIVMGTFSEHLRLLPALLILVPPTIDMRGNIFASLGSRLGTYLHTGEIEPSFKMNPILSQNISSSLTLTGLTSLFLGFLSTIVANLMGIGAAFEDLILISIMAGFISAILMLLSTFLIAFLSFKRGWDPDNVSAPLITLMGDMITLPIMFLSLKPVMSINYVSKIILVGLFILLISIHSLIHFGKNKRIHSRIIKEALPVLFMCGLIGILSGSILTTRIEGLIAVPGILILIPPFLEDGGAISGIIASRLSTSLHLGALGYEKLLSRGTIRLFLFSHMLSIFVFSMVAIFGYTSAMLLGVQTLSLLDIFIASIISGEILTFIVNIITYYTAVLSFKTGIDPDNVTIPITTSVIDLSGSICFVGVLMIFGML